jgi:hypothetical protein
MEKDGHPSDRMHGKMTPWLGFGTDATIFFSKVNFVFPFPLDLV